MNRLLILLFFLPLIGSAQITYGPDSLAVPPLNSLKKWSTLDQTLIKRPYVDCALNPYSHPFRYMGEHPEYGYRVVEGWSYLVDSLEATYYRYTLYKAGEPIRTVGYYLSGTASYDYHLSGNTLSNYPYYWYTDIYSSQYIFTPNTYEGIQRNWYENGQLAMEAMYEKQRLVYRNIYDSSGNSLNYIQEHLLVPKRKSPFRIFQN